MLAFSVPGIPQPKGSARAFLPKGWTRPVVTTDNPKIKQWERDIARMADAAIMASRPRWQPLLEGGVSLVAAFHLPRPKTLIGALVAHVTRPDLDKLARCACDALTGVCWADDGQVNVMVLRKGYAAPGTEARVELRVRRTHPAPADLELALASAAAVLKECERLDAATCQDQAWNWLLGHAYTAHAYLQQLREEQR